MQYEYIDDEAFQNVIRSVPRSIRRNCCISSALAEIRDDLHKRLRGCADNVRVEVHLDDFMRDPIILRSGSGSNKVEINIDEWGNVSYNWVKKTWSTYCSNAWDTVKSITKSVLGGIVSWFGSLFGSNKSLEGSSRRYLTY